MFGHQATQVIQGDATRNAVIINALIYVTKNSGKQRGLCEMFAEIGKETIASKQVIQFHCFCSEE